MLPKALPREWEEEGEEGEGKEWYGVGGQLESPPHQMGPLGRNCT